MYASKKQVCGESPTFIRFAVFASSGVSMKTLGFLTIGEPRVDQPTKRQHDQNGFSRDICATAWDAAQKASSRAADDELECASPGHSSRALKITLLHCRTTPNSVCQPFCGAHLPCFCSPQVADILRWTMSVGYFFIFGRGRLSDGTNRPGISSSPLCCVLTPTPPSIYIRLP